MDLHQTLFIHGILFYLWYFYWILNKGVEVSLPFCLLMTCFLLLDCFVQLWYNGICLILLHLTIPSSIDITGSPTNTSWKYSFDLYQLLFAQIKLGLKVLNGRYLIFCNLQSFSLSYYNSISWNFFHWVLLHFSTFCGLSGFYLNWSFVPIKRKNIALLYMLLPSFKYTLESRSSLLLHYHKKALGVPDWPNYFYILDSIFLETNIYFVLASFLLLWRDKGKSQNETFNWGISSTSIVNFWTSWWETLQ